MLSFLLGLGAGTLCVLDPKGTRRVLATLLAKGQDLVAAASTETARLSHQVGEELSDIVAEARAQREQSK
jgi:hypothetical protein